MSSSLCVPSVGGLCISTDLSRMGSYTVALLGDERVGKTSIMRRMSGARCPEEYVPTVDENITQNFTLGDTEVEVTFMDTSGSSDFPAMRQLAIEKAQVVLIVFSVDDRHSYERVKQYRDEVLAIKNDDQTPIVVIANKMDLPSHTVDAKAADFYTCFESNYGFVAMSAKSDRSVRKLFNEILKKVQIPGLPNLEKVENNMNATGGKKPVAKTSSLPIVRGGSFKRSHKKVERKVSCHLQ
ncbi:GTPase KRas-like [Symsagittifera roscoffensis]|uniref:GTPase KRas-like n=1 Tax=Symsagittifera roscoffensis TaxID=84072 RepID=UPI00307B2D8B